MGGVGEVVVGLEILLGGLVGGVGDLGGEGGGGHVDCGGVVVVAEKNAEGGWWLLSWCCLTGVVVGRRIADGDVVSGADEILEYNKRRNEEL